MKKFTLIMAVVLAVTLASGIIVPVLSPAGRVSAMEETQGEGAVEANAVPTTPHWAYSKILWASMALMFSVLGTSLAQSRIGVAGAGAMAEKPELAGTYIVLIAIPETMVILGFVIAAMIILMV